MAREDSALRAANRVMKKSSKEYPLGELDATMDKVMDAITAIIALLGLVLVAGAMLGWLDRWLEPVFRIVGL